MKKLIVTAALLVIGATASSDNVPVIRTFSYSTMNTDYIVRRFDDGPNTCYTLTGDHYSGQAVSISCVVRGK